MDKKSTKKLAQMNYSKRFAMILMFSMALFFSISIVSAGDLSINPFADRKIAVPTIDPDMSDFIKADFNSEYGAIRLSKTFLWFETDKIAEYTLTKNTKYCLINCEAEGKVTMFENGILFDDVMFKTLQGGDTSIQSSEYLIFDGMVDNYVDVPATYKDVCEKEINATTGKEDCYQVIDTYKQENHPIEKWIKYDGSELRAGDYRWKIKGVKDPKQSVDFIPVRYDKDFSEWATWTASLNVGLRVYLNGSSLVDSMGNQDAVAGSSPVFNSSNCVLNDCFHVTTSKNFYLANSTNTRNLDSRLGREITLNFWFNPVGLVNSEMIMGSGTTNYAKAGQIFTNVLRLTDGFTDATPTSLPVSANKWTMITYVKNASNFYWLYQNGTLMDSGVYAGWSEGGTYVDTQISFGFVKFASASNNASNTYYDEISIHNRTLSASEVSDLWNGGIGLSYIPDTPATPLSISTALIYPTTAMTNATTVQTFSANSTAVNGNVTNMTLYLYRGATLSTNSTTGLSGLFNSTSNTYDLAEGNYTWNYYSCGTNSTDYSCVFGTNRTLNIDVPLLLSMTYPLNTSYAINVSALNYTVSGASACWYSLNGGSTNTTVACGTNLTGLTSTEGSNTWKIYANDTFNYKNVSTVVFYKDTVVPAITIVYPTATDYIVNVSTINFTITHATGTLDKCWYNNGTTNSTPVTCANFTGVRSNEGYNNWTVYANDTVGNLGSTAVGFYKDTIFPTADFVSPTNATGIELVNNGVINMNVTGADANITIRLYNNNTLVASNNSLSTNLFWSYDFGTTEKTIQYNASVCSSLPFGTIQCNNTATRTTTLTSFNVSLGSPTDNSIYYDTTATLNCSSYLTSTSSNSINNLSLWTNIGGTWTFNATSITGVGVDAQDGHGVALNTGASYTNYLGVKFRTHDNLILRNVTKASGSSSGMTAILWNSTRGQIANESFSGDLATFSNISLDENTEYYIVTYKAGNSYMYKQNGAGVSFPYNKTNIDFTATWNGGADATTDLYQIVSIGTTNTGGASATSGSFTASTLAGDFIWNCQSCLVSGACVFASANRTVLTYPITAGHHASGSSVGGGSSVTFTLYVNATDISTNYAQTTANLTFNNTVYAFDTIDLSDPDFIKFTKTVTTSIYDGNGTGIPTNFYWAYSVKNTTTTLVSRTTDVQTIDVYSLTITDCALTSGRVILNMSLMDEETVILVNKTSPNTASIELDVEVTSQSNPLNVLYFSKRWINNNSASICVPNGLLNVTTYIIDFTVAYDSTSHVREFFYMENGTLDNTNYFNSYTDNTIDLLDLATADSTTFLFEYTDADAQKVDDIIVHTFRKYIGEGLFREVERSKQDNAGQTHVHLVEEDVIYYFMITQFGHILYTSDTYNAKCLSSPCEISLSASATAIDWDVIEDVGRYYNISTNKATRTVTTSFSLDTISLVNSTVYRFYNGEYELINSGSLTATAGSIPLTIPLSYNNATFFIKVVSDGSLIRWEQLSLKEDAKDYFGTFGAILGGLVVLALMLMAVSEGAGLIIFTVLALIIISALQLVDLGWVSLISIICAGGIIIMKLVNRRGSRQ